jgi:hypothetical protein
MAARVDSIVTESVPARTPCHPDIRYEFRKPLIQCRSFDENVGALSALKG